MKVRMTLASLLCLACLAGTAEGKVPAAKQKWQWQYRVWLPPVWQRIAQCETGTNWQHNSGTYQGAFGFYHGSWDQFNTFGYPSEAYLATPWQQYRVALAIYKRFGFSGWGCYMNRAWVREG